MSVRMGIGNAKGRRVQRVRKAVIPAAGYGTRFLPATKALTKEMLPIVDRPAIQYIVEEAVASGIDDILIITGRGKESIENHFDRNLELNEHLRAQGKAGVVEELAKIEDMAEIHYLRQKEALGLGHTVLCAEKFIGDEPFALMLGDDLVKSRVPALRQLLEVHDKYDASVIAVEEVLPEQTSHYGIVKARNYSNPCLVESLVEKPAPGTAPSNLAILGRYVIKPEIFPIMRQTPFGKSNELQITDGLNALCKQSSVFAQKVEGKWYTVGGKVEYLKTVLAFAVDRNDLGDFNSFLKRLAESELK